MQLELPDVAHSASLKAQQERCLDTPWQARSFFVRSAVAKLVASRNVA